MKKKKSVKTAKLSLTRHREQYYPILRKYFLQFLDILAHMNFILAAPHTATPILSPRCLLLNSSLCSSSLMKKIFCSISYLCSCISRLKMNWGQMLPIHQALGCALLFFFAKQQFKRALNFLSIFNHVKVRSVDIEKTMRNLPRATYPTFLWCQAKKEGDTK